MQKNFQQHKQFVTEFGSLLIAQTNQRQPMHQRQAVANLAEYIGAARRHHKVSRAALAYRTGKSEVEIFALEQGIYPYAQIDPVFLCRLAAALGEEVETLTLLLGRPPLMLAAGAKAPTGGCAVVCHATHRRTISQHFDNRKVTLPRVKVLYENCLNLIDSLREGRLLSQAKATYCVGVTTAYRAGAMVAVVSCLLLFWVSTYSLANFFDAQLTVQSYATVTVPINTDHTIAQYVGTQAIPTPLDAPLVSSKEAVTVATPYQRLKQTTMTINPANTEPTDTEPTDEEEITVTPLFIPAADESQECILRTTGRFTLCRV